MNVIPGYHAAVALVLWATGRTGLFSARLVSTLISALAVLVFYLLAWTVERRSALVRTLQFAFFPILFPFFSLVYMDILALLLALLGFLLVLRRHYSLAGLAGILSVLARTNNISWMAFCSFFCCIRSMAFDWRAPFRREELPLLALTWGFWLGFALFAAFLVLNKGIAIGENPRNRCSSSSWVISTSCSFSSCRSSCRSSWRTCGASAGWSGGASGFLGALLLLFGVFLLTYHNTHPYNNVLPGYYVRNALLIAADQQFRLEAGALHPGIPQPALAGGHTPGAKIVLLAVPLHGPEPGPILAGGARYYFVPYSLFILMQARRSRPWNGWQPVTTWRWRCSCST